MARSYRMDARLPALGLIACLLLTSCMVESDEPLIPPESAKPDAELLGNWRSDDAVFKITPGHDAWMHLKVIPDAKDEKKETYEVFPSVIGTNHFLNVRIVDDDLGKGRHAYLFFRYLVTPDHHLRIWILSEEATSAAIKAGKLKGTFKKTKSSPGTPVNPDYDVSVHSSSSELLKFIRDGDVNVLFHDELKPLVKAVP